MLHEITLSKVWFGESTSDWVTSSSDNILRLIRYRHIGNKYTYSGESIIEHIFGRIVHDSHRIITFSLPKRDGFHDSLELDTGAADVRGEQNEPAVQHPTQHSPTHRDGNINAAPKTIQPPQRNHGTDWPTFE